jgi:Uncharacterised protein family (UPF0160)
MSHTRRRDRKHQKFVSSVLKSSANTDPKCSICSQVIGTHNGTFHCDEALAVYMLRLTEAYRDAGLFGSTINVV